MPIGLIESEVILSRKRPDGMVMDAKEKKKNIFELF
jgi:hypothetical protein